MAAPAWWPAEWAIHVTLPLAMLLGHSLVMAFGAHVHVHGATPVAAGWAGTAMPLLAGLGVFLAAWRWWLGCDVGVGTVPVRTGTVQTSAASGAADSRRRVPQA